MQSFVPSQIAYLVKTVRDAVLGPLNVHKEDLENPHSVTAAQAGAAPLSHVSNVSNPHSVTAAQAGAAPLSHASSTTNPHSVTAAQTGAPSAPGDIVAVYSAEFPYVPDQLSGGLLFAQEVTLADLGFPDTPAAEYQLWFTPVCATFSETGPNLSVVLVSKAEATFIVGVRSEVSGVSAPTAAGVATLQCWFAVLEETP
jgi:hypothetical protein